MKDTGTTSTSGAAAVQSLPHASNSTNINAAQGCDKRAVIAEIRAERMMDVDVPSTVLPGMDSLRAMCGRALDKLSRDLYESRSHFLFEMLQNSDDNRLQLWTGMMCTLHYTTLVQVRRQCQAVCHDAHHTEFGALDQQRDWLRPK